MELVRIGKHVMVSRNLSLESGRTCVWSVWNHKQTDPRVDYALGRIEWETGWRQYVFKPAEGTLYSADCLRDIAAFCETNRQTRR